MPLGLLTHGIGWIRLKQVVIKAVTPAVQRDSRCRIMCGRPNTLGAMIGPMIVRRLGLRTRTRRPLTLE
jgi:hypothetical protein